MAKYILTGTILDQQENPIAEKPILFQLMYFPKANTSGVISATELWITTTEEGQIPENTYLTPGYYRIEWRIGAVVNKAYFVMPESDTELQNAVIYNSELENITNLSACYKSYETIADLLASDATKWTNAEARNYYPQDGNVTLWYTTQNPAILPNGTDVLQTDGGVTIVRYFAREATGGETVQGEGLQPYTVSVPLTVPTIEDLDNSLFTAPLVFIGSESTPMAFIPGEDGPEDMWNNVTNEAGVKYKRIRFT